MRTFYRVAHRSDLAAAQTRGPYTHAPYPGHLLRCGDGSRHPGPWLDVPGWAAMVVADQSHKGWAFGFDSQELAWTWFNGIRGRLDGAGFVLWQYHVVDGRRNAQTGISGRQTVARREALRFVAWRRLLAPEAWHHEA